MSILKVEADSQQQVGKTGDSVQIEMSVSYYVTARYGRCQARKSGTNWIHPSVEHGTIL